MANGNPVILGKSDNATRETKIDATTPPTESGLSVQNLFGTGIQVGTFIGTALVAGSAGGTAIFAESFAGSGVVSTCIDTRDIPGINFAVSGTVPGGFGVMGHNVRGQFPQAGVIGRAVDAIGVDGISRAFGVRGLAKGNTDSIGVLGVGSSGHGIVGIAMRPSLPSGPLFAGMFRGNVQVQGDFTVTGNKSAVVPHPDGTHRRLYCVESPENWFEDFGTGKLHGGRATVALDETFSKLVICKNYHVFLTPEGDCNGLYVHSKNNSGFEVRELQKGTSAVRFSFRIVARRRDAKGKRLEIVELGRLPERADAVVTAPKSSGKRSDGRLAAELAALAKQGKQKKKVASRPKEK